jgi:putative FmdB family regulatory protein
MPIYECHCLSCDLTFEVLAPLSKSRKRQECPDCGQPAQRIVSAFAIASSSKKAQLKKQNGERTLAKTEQRPLCLQNPHLPLLCHMDEISAKRWIAHSKGRGTEFDDKLAKREELRKERGEPKPAKPADSHVHSHRRHANNNTETVQTPSRPNTQSQSKPHSHSHGSKSDGHSHSHGHAHPHGHAHSH